MCMGAYDRARACMHTAHTHLHIHKHTPPHVSQFPTPPTYSPPPNLILRLLKSISYSTTRDHFPTPDRIIGGLY